MIVLRLSILLGAVQLCGVCGTDAAETRESLGLDMMAADAAVMRVSRHQEPKVWLLYCAVPGRRRSFLGLLRPLHDDGMPISEDDECLDGSDTCALTLSCNGAKTSTLDCGRPQVRMKLTANAEPKECSPKSWQEKRAAWHPCSLHATSCTRVTICFACGTKVVLCPPFAGI